MHVGRYLSAPAVKVAPEAHVEELAAFMWRHDIGFLPVVTGDQIVGVVTDRDLAIQVLGRPPEATHIRAFDIMRTNVQTCLEDQPLAEAAALMGDHQVRRFPVLCRDGSLAGVLSLGDVAENISDRLAGETLGEIVEDR